ncbi:hypothetical protein QYF61_019425 [Mycteria americana]|uniref:Keratin n=1 Tax=Mycteria americana TaxID=33587 RepID=A0AAN7N321_MYCAM|nr:hypothetical protein QYF61_019425 [Mycteria americana]
MSCYDLCRPCGPTPLANSCNEPCVRQCQDSRVVIQPSPVVVTLPGPILSSFPQNTAVGSTTSAAVGSILSEEGVPISSGGFSLSGLGLNTLNGHSHRKRHGAVEGCVVWPDYGKGGQELPQGTREQQVRLDTGSQLMRQAIDVLEDISVQASTHLAKAVVAWYHLQCVLALPFSKHFFQTLEPEGVPKELKGHGAARATV